MVVKIIQGGGYMNFKSNIRDQQIGKPRNFIFLGATNFSRELLVFLIEKGFIPDAIFAIPKRFKISYSKDFVINYNFADLKEIAIEYKIPYFEVDGTEGKKLKDYKDVIASFKPQLILVLGWYYMVPKYIRDIASLGAWGIHASLLPRYRGGAPLVWAIINGEKETGVTLFKLSDGVDDGDIIAQKSFPIDFSDAISDVYSKAIEASKEILIESLLNDNLTFIPQKDINKFPVYPQRKPEDGKIDWAKDTIKIYNFIRAQTKPYPGAYTTVGGKKLIIWNAKPFKVGITHLYKKIIA